MGYTNNLGSRFAICSVSFRVSFHKNTPKAKQKTMSNMEFHGKEVTKALLPFGKAPLSTLDTTFQNIKLSLF